MSYDTLKIEPGRQRIDVIDITVEGCANVYGSTPCEASFLENRFSYSEEAGTWDPFDCTLSTVTPASLPTGATTAIRIDNNYAGATMSINNYDNLHTQAGLPLTVHISVLTDGYQYLRIQTVDGYVDFDINLGTIVVEVGSVTGAVESDGGSWKKYTITTPSVGESNYISFLFLTSASATNGVWVSKIQSICATDAPDEYVMTSGLAKYKTDSQKCFNSWATCQDTANYVAEDKVISFCTPVSVIPDGCIPFLDNVKGDSGQLDPENSLGKRGQITVNLTDAPHDDSGIDPYVDERAYSALESGTFWPRFRARFPFYQGRKLEWYQGYYPFARANAKKRTYIIEDLRGWGRSGKVTIVAKDPLKLADDKRAQWPRASTGTLTSALTAVATPTTIDITTSDDTEYDLEDYETTAVVIIGSEIIPYTGTTTITGGVRLTGVGTRGTVDDYQTPVAAHDAGVSVQKCAYFKDMKVPHVYQVLLERGGSVPAAYIDYPTWEAEYDTWMPDFTVTRLIVKPEGVTTTIKELVQQSMTWAIWWDNEAAEIRYQVVRSLDYDELISTFTDGDNLIAGSSVVSDDSDRLTNQILFRYGQIDPTKKADEATNYREAFVAIDVGSQSPQEHGQTFSQTINGVWHGTGNRTALVALADRMLQSRSGVPVKVEFEVDRKDDDAKTGQFVRLETSAITDIYGQPVPKIVRLIQQDAGGDTVKYVAREELLATGFARIAPDTYAAGFSYPDATADEKQRYAFIADDATGLLGGTDPGTKIL